VIWTLIVVTTIKYVSFAMRVDNDGEGGILALMSLLGVKRQHRPVIVAVGLFGAALIYGDGAITPAISVLSALEGLDIVTSTFHPYILPAAVVILIALFAIQPLGTTRIGRAFGPIMPLWFAVMAILGLWGNRTASQSSVRDRSALRSRLSARGWTDRLSGAWRCDRVHGRHNDCSVRRAEEPT
jgi:KUP system potassium uptake protein